LILINSTSKIKSLFGGIAQGYPGAIPPKSDLIFEVELIKINN
jgi:hypothetical protein